MNRFYCSRSFLLALVFILCLLFAGPSAQAGALTLQSITPSGEDVSPLEILA